MCCSINPSLHIWGAERTNLNYQLHCNAHCSRLLLRWRLFFEARMFRAPLKQNGTRSPCKSTEDAKIGFLSSSDATLHLFECKRPLTSAKMKNVRALCRKRTQKISRSPVCIEEKCVSAIMGINWYFSSKAWPVTDLCAGTPTSALACLQTSFQLFQ